MRLLFIAAFRSRRHFTLALLTMVSLLLLTFANQCEMSSIGLMANTGADFFVLFGKEGARKVRLQEVLEKWNKIDHNRDGAISKQDAASFMAQQKGANPLSWISHKITAQTGSTSSRIFRRSSPF